MHMKHSLKRAGGAIGILLAVWVMAPGVARAQADPGSRHVALQVFEDAAPRVKFGAERLANALRAAGYQVDEQTMTLETRGEGRFQLEELVVLGESDGRPVRIMTLIDAEPLMSLAVEGDLTPGTHLRHPEGYMLGADPDGMMMVTGGGDSGTLYGCIELAHRVEQTGLLPMEINVADSPEFKLRGPCIGMQKTSILPGRGTYEYPYTPELFPWFYDKETWREYLDVLVENRMNTLYLWNGHPFASLVKLEKYPYALEVSEETFQMNQEAFQFLTEEADKRGIWVIQMFYNIFVSKPFAEHHGIDTQHGGMTPLIADYNKLSIAKFVEQYPNVGLLVCLGEAQNRDKPEWMRDVVIGGVKEGLARLGKTEEPPIVLRAHTLGRGIRDVVEESLTDYKNLYTMAKYNGESLTTYTPRGNWQLVHLDMALLRSTNVVNVHLMSNLEPFRYGATDFIRKSVIACRDRLGAQGVHLYPLAYWDWPNTPDKLDPYMKQYDRDWIWFDSWARYTWDPDRDPAAEAEYWAEKLGEMYGSEEAGRLILEAYETSGECLPTLIRRFGITEGNRQTFTLGMLLEQLVRPAPWGPYEGLWQDQAPPGERLDEYAAREWTGKPHHGETPPQVINDAEAYAARAVAAMEMADPLVTENREEFERLKNDMVCVQLVTKNYAEKVRAAMLELRYDYSSDRQDMLKAARHLERSLDYFRQLEERTRDTYRYANTLQTRHRRIPVRAPTEEPAFYHWSQMLPIYEEEFSDFEEKVAHLDSVTPTERDEPGEKLTSVDFRLLSGHAETYTVEAGENVYTDQQPRIMEIAEELRGLTGIRFSHRAARDERMSPIRIAADVPFKVLVGFIDGERRHYAPPPNLDTDSEAQRLGADEIRMENVARISGLGQVNLHSYEFAAGEIEFTTRTDGSYLILGVVPADAEIKPRRTGILPGQR